MLDELVPRLVTGLPSIQISSIKKHVEHFSHGEFSKYMCYLGNYEEASPRKIQKAFKEIKSTKNQYSNIVDQTARLTDGYGVERLSAVIHNMH